MWKERVTGGVAVLEVSRSDDAGWHPHLHVLITGGFLPQAAISQRWLAVTGDSAIVDIRAVSTRHGVGYVCKYLSKPGTGSASWKLEDRIHFAKAIAGRKSVISFGNLKRLRLLNGNKKEWLYKGSINALHLKARKGSEQAKLILSVVYEFWNDAMAGIEFTLPGEQAATSGRHKPPEPPMLFERFPAPDG